MALLEVNHLNISFGGLHAVDDFHVSIEKGQLYGLIGPNGAGKTTIFNLLTGVYKPDEGIINLDGQDITPMSIDERANAGIGFALQQPPAFKGMTVRRLLNLAAGTKLPEHVSCRLLSSVGICAKEYLDREVDATLSGGERKRVEIATVMAKDHKVSIFDEPEAGIDLWSFSMLVKQFEQIHREKKESLVLISHQERIIRMADRIMVVRDGRVESCGSKEEIAHQLFLDGAGCACLDREGGNGNETGCSY